MAYSAAVLGASGYGGGEVLRYLACHPGVAVEIAAAGGRAGEAVAAVQPHLSGATGAAFATVEEARAADVDVLFSCLPGGELPKHIDDVGAPLLVDLADDHRGSGGEWIYGLTEFARDSLPGATRIANPGCYPTATLLAALPFARAGVCGGGLIVDAISGVSGAGRRIEDRLTLGTAGGSVGAYGSTAHRHVPEMERALAAFGGIETTVSFTPHLAPMPRGLVATVRAPLTRDLDDDGALDILRSAYDGEPFVEVVSSWPQSKPVAGTNRAHVSARVDARAGWLVAAAAIDNLGKGAAGQAIQNANLALGLDEAAGLGGYGVWP